jgi:hypothetical protein
MKKSCVVKCINTLSVDDPLYISISKSIMDKYGDIFDIQPKYEVEYNGVIKRFRNLNECSEFTGKSLQCLFRLLTGMTVYKKKSSEDLKNIRISKIDKDGQIIKYDNVAVSNIPAFSPAENDKNP